MVKNQLNFIKKNVKFVNNREVGGYLDDYDYLISEFPMTEWEWGMQYI